ncbi:metallo-beta-lactamase superfamily hydrolase [Clostridium sp. DL-VIII]|uniref:MBL fold metallo-hydrolase n=1 Tax=Clostridium sp. DL-VIII TaxID=641107 RepID=UPI00023AFA7D|nr:MBL fold metallo-hydrolase [Clostridium sp. DL-VIII]EHI99396.1 metallo-beta-lactamase superfamily hydrolase [Clostridium sp. DL-VIII]
MEIIEGVNMLDCTEKSHVYLIRDKENILIDTGLPGEAEKILSEIKFMNIELNSIKHILLTHHDIGHVGNAKILQDETGAALWASKEDAPYIIGKKSRLGVKRIVQTFIRYKKPIINYFYNGYENIRGIRVIKTPGHTPGHVIFMYKNVLFTGDLFIIVKENIKLLPKDRNWNQYNLEKSLGLLKNLECEWICPAHGTPIMKNDIWEEFVKKY